MQSIPQQPQQQTMPPVQIVNATDVAPGVMPLPEINSMKWDQGFQYSTLDAVEVSAGCQP